MICPVCGAEGKGDFCGECGSDKTQVRAFPEPKSFVEILTDFLKRHWYLVLVFILILLIAKGLSTSFWDFVSMAGFFSAIAAVIGTLIAAFRRKPYWKNWAAGIGIACMVFLAGAVNAPEYNGETDPDQTEPSAQQTAQPGPRGTSPASPPVAASQQQPASGLGLTPNEFKNRFNSASGVYGQKYSIDKIEVNESRVFTHYFSEGVKMLCIVDNDSLNIVEISLTKDTNANLSESADYTIIIGNIAQSLVPEVSGTKRDEFLKALIPVGERNFNNTITKNGIKFRAAAVDGYLNFWVYME